MDSGGRTTKGDDMTAAALISGLAVGNQIAGRLLNHSLNVVLERSVFQAGAVLLYAFANWVGQ